MTTTKSAKTVKSTAFAWDEENTAKAGDLYNQMVEERGVEFANENLKLIHYVRALVKAAEAKGLEVEADSLDSLESSKMSALKILADIAGVQVTGE